MANLNGNETATTVRRSQVYLATHNGEGKTLPYMNRSFISFTYGGKKIEDFDLIATISGDRLNRLGYAEFDDTVTTYDNLDGLHYWATHYKSNQMDFTLSTDGIDLKMLDQFLHWFKPGTIRELILAEHPNRAIMARVSLPPTLNLLPFEHDVQIIISGSSYTTKTTLYKGDIELSLVMDKPHWYGITNVLGKKTTVAGRDRYEDVWDDITTGLLVSVFASQDALKILYEDGIPLGSMIENNMLLGNGAYAQVENLDISLIWSASSSTGAKIDDGTGTLGIIAGAIVNASDEGITTLDSGSYGYFFYSGTAPAPTILSFTMTPRFSDLYISVPKNSYTVTNLGAVKYNIITIESLNKLEFCFTTPNIFTSYNTAIKVFTNYAQLNTDWETVRKAMRETVRHPEVRAFAIGVINTYAVAGSTIGNAGKITASTSTALSTLLTAMKKFFTGTGSTMLPATFVFNSETGEALGTFTYYSDGQNSTTVTEDVGDMLRSNYIILLDRNYPTSLGKIKKWASTNSTTKLYSHRIKHDVTGGLTNLLILYKNMYL